MITCVVVDGRVLNYLSKCRTESILLLNFVKVHFLQKVDVLLHMICSRLR